MLKMTLLKLFIFALFSCVGAQALCARQIDPRTPPPPPPPEKSSAPPASTSDPAPASSSPMPPIDPSVPPPPPPAGEPAPAAPVFDPLHAQRSLDVGTFYLKKGNYDAAIDRFQEAARFQPSLAKPWLLLGETFEKKRDNAHAIESYKKYLELFPGAEDAAKIQKRITTLEEKPGQQASRKPAN